MKPFQICRNWLNMNENIIYLDNAATSFPKPESVYEAVNRAMREECGNPGRSGHRLSLAADRNIREARMLCAKLFGAQSPDNIVFAQNTTESLNIAIKGLLSPGDHVITSSLEHNSVSRPLHFLRQSGVEVTKLPVDINHGLNTDDIKKAMRHNTKLVVCTHISNVTGTVNDISTIGAFCRENGFAFLVDAAQSAGARHIDVIKMNIDLLAFPGHKGLLGPQGTGGLYIRQGISLKTIIQGGTGSDSELLEQPDTMPCKFESGTLNTPGLSGLAAGIRFILKHGIEEIERRESEFINQLTEGINGIDDIQLIGPVQGCDRGNVISIRIKSISPANAALMMDSVFNIAVRSGLHCAADAHRSIGTLESGGTLRISPNYFNTNNNMEQCLNALSLCAKDF